jgi:hypothetical protein
MISLDELEGCHLPRFALPVMLKRIFQSIEKVVMVPITVVVHLVFWMSGGRINWSFGRIKIPEDVQFAMMLYHSPSMQRMYTESLTRIVESAMKQSVNVTTSKEALLNKRLTDPSPIIVRRVQPRRVGLQSDGIV